MVKFLFFLSFIFLKIFLLSMTQNIKNLCLFVHKFDIKIAWLNLYGKSHIDCSFCIFVKTCKLEDYRDNNTLLVPFKLKCDGKVYSANAFLLLSLNSSVISSTAFGQAVQKHCSKLKMKCEGFWSLFLVVLCTVRP